MNSFSKRLFVSFLACLYRIAEFRAISISMSSFSPHHILLKTHPSFFSKTQTDDFFPSPIIIPAFPELPLICPVSLINKYLLLTERLCAEKGVSRPDHLWLSTNLKPISTYLIRKWVRDVIFLGDPLATNQGTHVHSIRAHVATHFFGCWLHCKGGTSLYELGLFVPFTSLLCHAGGAGLSSGSPRWTPSLGLKNMRSYLNSFEHCSVPGA